MNDMPRRELVAALLDRTASMVKDDAPAVYLAANLLAGQFGRDDSLYDDKFCLSGDHALNAVLDAAALSISRYVFEACGYVKLAAQIDVDSSTANARAAVGSES